MATEAPDEVTVDADRLQRMCNVGLASIRYCAEVVEEAPDELRRQRQEQRIKDRFLDLLDTLRESYDDDFTLPWLDDDDDWDG